MRRLMVLVAVCVAVLAIGGVAGGQAQTPNPCIDSPNNATYQWQPGAITIIHGEGNATVTLIVSGTASDTFIGATTAYSGAGRFSATLIAPDGDENPLLTAINPMTQVSLHPIGNGTATLEVTADAAWAVILQ